MKPEQFIREYGLDKAREVVEGAPDRTASHYVVDTDTYYSEEFLTYFDHSLEDWETADLNNIGELETIYEHVVSLSDLKRLVESVELINLFGSIKIAKAKVKMADFNGFLLVSVPIENGLADVYIHKVEQAIRDHESIYGGGDES
ncbi:hypothetical protein [Acinetobacter baumannii]|uniref:hypothetical protein n=1 Tax=Acinetobacter baumannii TaxID=470 RepID=UPI0005A7F9EE|nr:hypothetical protein [Acinetobacter baumannii]EKV2265908.1 hypothetical protein [Acinetobacter baumannii]MBC6799777.1 hypothetical protein [Acinetobacter baumannii]MBO2809096.1 hypothetical protein [Acinetobacter baumannii]MBO2867806.1 hypothetical protein [Acinetobacter baumannii]MBO2999410.1 hypothetical protein [Acinetobacter baumannii]